MFDPIHLIFFHNGTDGQAKLNCLNYCIHPNKQQNVEVIPQQIRPDQIPIYQILDGCHT